MLAAVTHYVAEPLWQQWLVGGGGVAIGIGLYRQGKSNGQTNQILKDHDRRLVNLEDVRKAGRWRGDAGH